MKKDNQLVFSATTIVVPVYLAAIAGAEVIGVFVGVVPGAVGHALLVLTLLSHYALKNGLSYRRVLPVLALAPLLRILSLTIPIREIPLIYWYAMIGVPLLLAVALTKRLLSLSWIDLGLRSGSWLPQILIALSGLPLSLLAFFILRPNPLIATFAWREVTVGAIILLIFTGFTEELMFRGLLQQVASEAFGRVGLFYSSAVFTIMYIGSLSWGYVLFIGLLSLFFGWCVHRTGSIWGVALAHGVLNIGMAFVWPFVWR